jgi:hypothetical protein
MEPNWPPLSEASIRDAVAERLAALSALSFEELVALPASAGVPAISLGPRPAELWTYVDSAEGERVQVVVQLTAPATPGSRWSQVYAEGFRRARDGSIQPVNPRDIYEFM